MMFFVATVAGCIDAMAGGGGLITIPVMLSIGVPPVSALATNKLQSSAGSFSASFYFVRAGMVNLREMVIPMAFTFFGSMCGTLLVQHIDAGFLVTAVPVMLVLIATYFLFSKNLEGGEQKISLKTFAMTCGLCIGFYDGFFGPGTGSFFAMAFVSLLGMSLAKATAHTKVLNCTSNLAALAFFILGGHILWTLGFAMMGGQFIGARIGSRMVLTKGQRLIRPVIVMVCLIMSIRLIIQQMS
ncbi:hypothetical protein E1189_16250 [Sansalvadorimonas verongulae]|nr:hypothetical protein [Sansalvadorimonas verongulae]